MLSATALMWTRIAAGIFAFLAVNAGYGIWLQLKKSRGGQNWRVTQGEIITSAISTTATHTSDDDSDYTANITYRYKVGAKDYEGHRVRFGSPSRISGMQAEGLTGKYPVGAKISIYYDPERPSKSVLEPKNRNSVAALVALFVVFTMITAVLVSHAIAGKVLTMANGTPLFAFLFPLAAIGFGIAAIGAYWKLRQDRLASRAWPTVQGHITRSEVVTEIERSTDDKGRETSEERFRVALQFAYAVGGREFHSSHWNWGWTALHGDIAAAQAVAAKYPSGSAVAVYYDPMRPETAVLNPNDKGGVAAPLVAGIFLLLVGAVFLWALNQGQWT